MEVYGDRIREARKAKHMTQEELGELIGVSGVTIMRYEKYQREPRMEQLQKIGEALGVNWTYLLGSTIGGSTLEEAAAIHQEAEESFAASAGLELILESIYGKRREVTVKGKWYDETLSVYGEGGDAFCLGDEACMSIEEALRALVKSLVSTLGTPAAQAEADLQTFLSSKEAKQLNDEAVARDKARIQAMKRQRVEKSSH